MQRFEMIEGGSAKFWEVSTDGVDLTVCFGRIGTSGQSKTKSFDTADKAQAEASKLIKEKTGKGYSEVSGAQAQTTPAAVSNPIASKPVSPKAKLGKPGPLESTESTPGQSVAAAPIAQVPIAQAPISQAPIAQVQSDFSVPVVDLSEVVPVKAPEQEFVFSAADISKLPIFRGISKTHYKPELSKLSGWAEGVAKQIERGYLKKALADAQGTWQNEVVKGFAQRFEQNGAPFWTIEQCNKAMDRAQLLKADVAHWAEVLIHHYFAEFQGHNSTSIVRGLELCLALRGAEFALQALLQVWELAFPLDDYGRNGHLYQLRSAIAAADDAEHQKLLEIAHANVGQDPAKTLLVSCLFPHVEAFTNQAQFSTLLATSAYSFDSLRKLIAAKKIALNFYSDAFLPPLLLWVKRFGADQALELVMLVYEQLNDAWSRKALLGFIERLQRPKLIELLVEWTADRDVKGLLDKLCSLYPEESIRAAVERAAKSKSKDLEQWAIRFATSQPAALSGALGAISPHLREKFVIQLKRLERQSVPVSELPSILANPPWLQKIKVSAIASINLPKLEVADQFDWQGKAPTIGGNEKDWVVVEFERIWKKLKNNVSADKRDRHFHIHVLSHLRIKNDARIKILDGADFKAEDQESHVWRRVDNLLFLPKDLALRLLDQLPVKDWSSVGAEDVRNLLATLGLPALPSLLRIIQAQLSERISCLMCINSVHAVPLIADAVKRLKRSRADGFRWLRRFPETAALGLMPLAFDHQATKEKALRDSAQYCLRWMHANGLADALAAAAKRFGAACEQTLAALFAIDPLHILPAKLPVMPNWFTPGAYPRPELQDGRPISVAASSSIGMMVNLSTLDEPYGGLEIVKEHLSAASLAEFAWAVFGSWIDAGAPSKENFGFLILGLLGNDETARKLAPKIREWPGESQHARAVTGLDFLAAIGSDVALMHLNAIADKAKFKGLQERAKLKIADVAETRGFTREELGDRLVPNLGLDEVDGNKLDFGARHFKIHFDESLKPYVSDASGVRLKDLPKPIKSDDAKLSGEATERFKAIKKDAKAIASQQLARLEQAMVLRRRWSAADFKLFFLDHPLMHFMAQRLLWGAYDGGKLMSAFRVAEDLSFADQNDASYLLAEHHQVGICHAYELEKAQVLSFGEIFADYHILQPFRQLGREVYLLTDKEKTAKVLTRFADRKVATLSVMGLNGKGWQRDGAQDGGWVGEFKKRLPEGLEAKLRIDPGTVIGDPNYEAEQCIPEIEVRKADTWNEERINLGDLHPILMSEILRDLDLLPTAAKK